MRRLSATLGFAVLLSGMIGDGAAADPKFPEGDARRSMGNLRPTRPAEAPRPPTPSPSPSPQPVVPAWRYYPNYGGNYVYPYPYSPYPYRYDNYGYPYYPYQPYYGYSYYPPPVFLPAETLYGPQAVKRFMGVDQWSDPRPSGRAAPAAERSRTLPLPAAERSPAPAPPKDPSPRATGQSSHAKAWRSIGSGDTHFEAGQYAEADAEYRKASEAAPRLGETWLRLGYAQAAMGKYDEAAKVLKRGLALNPTWPESKFRNDELYGKDQAAKKAHLDAMTQAAQQRPNDADLLFVLGVYLHFDGQTEQAAARFQHAAELVGRNDAHLRRFLKAEGKKG